MTSARTIIACRRLPAAPGFTRPPKSGSQAMRPFFASQRSFNACISFLVSMCLPSTSFPRHMGQEQWIFPFAYLPSIQYQLNRPPVKLLTAAFFLKIARFRCNRLYARVLSISLPPFCPLTAYIISYPPKIITEKTLRNEKPLSPDEESPVKG